MLSAHDVDLMFGIYCVPRERQEILFQISPWPRDYWNFDRPNLNYRVTFYITTMDDIGDIDPDVIRGRHIEIEYKAGSERRARYLADLIRRSEPLSAFFITPQYDWNVFESGRWVCKINHKDLKRYESTRHQPVHVAVWRRSGLRSGSPCMAREPSPLDQTSGRLH